MKSMSFLVGLFLVFSFSHVQAQTRTQMERAVDNYLNRNFDREMLGIFTYAGNVEIRDATLNTDGSYFVQGKFDYQNFIGFQVRRSFRATIKVLLGEYSVRKFEFYFPDAKDIWSWHEI